MEKRTLWSVVSMMLILCLLVGCSSVRKAEQLTTPKTDSKGSAYDTKEDNDFNAEDTKKDNISGTEAVKGGTDSAKDDTTGDLSKEEGSLWNFSYRLLAENLNEENPVLSPVSAYLAMGMTGLGAAGDTLAEFEAAMGKDMHDVSARLMERLPAEPGDLNHSKESKLHINLANSIWVDDDMEPKEQWVQGVSDIYRALAFRTDLSTDDTMEEINQWIEEETRELITNFLTRPLPQDTRMALFNTVYFLGEWMYQFDEYATREDIFVKEDGSEEKVEMMRDSYVHRAYVSGEDYDGVVLPYRDSNMAMVLLKPTAGQSVRELYESFTEEKLVDALAAEENTLINLKLPKFEVTFDQSLNESLQNMGIKRAFDREFADFSAIGNSKTGEPVYIDLVRQKAVVKVDEEGTEAAAVTMVVMAEGAMMEGPDEVPIDVFFDEPFLYMIVEKELAAPLFMGIMDCPQQ